MSAIAVEGLRDLQRAFRVADETLSRELTRTLREVAEPVRTDAERLAVSGIRHITLPWSQMRIGVTRSSVYIAPKRRGSRFPQNRRPNFAGLLLHRAMLPALSRNEQQVQEGMEELLDTVGLDWERA
jgi:hypothetical protein